VVEVQEPNYKNYTLAELEDVLAHIDKDAFSERYQNALAHYQQKLKDPQAVHADVDREDNNTSSQEKLYLQVILSFIGILFFGWWVVDAVLTGVTYTKKGRLIALANDPSGFYVHVSMPALLLGGSLLMLFQVYKKLAAADTQKTESVDAKREAGNRR
jgi:hypothetical protein